MGKLVILEEEIQQVGTTTAKAIQNHFSMGEG